MMTMTVYGLESLLVRNDTGTTAELWIKPGNDQEFVRHPPQTSRGHMELCQDTEGMESAKVTMEHDSIVRVLGSDMGGRCIKIEYSTHVRIIRQATHPPL